MQTVVTNRYFPFKPLHELTDGDIGNGCDHQMEMVAHQDKGMKLHGDLQADLGEHFEHHLFFRLAKENPAVRGSVPDVIGVVVAHGATLKDTDLFSPRVAAVQAILANQPSGKAVPG